MAKRILIQLLPVLIPGIVLTSTILAEFSAKFLTES